MRAVGVILAGGNSRRMKELSKRRAVCAMPVAGSYRSIDFALSNMEHSRIQKVAVLTQYNSRSLNEHLASSKWWDFGRKQGGMFLFTPSFADANSQWYRGTADAIAQNISFLKKSHEPYVVISSGDGVYKLDYNKVLEYHIAKKADITVVCKDFPENSDVSRFGCVKMNEEARIIDFEEKPLVASSRTISTGIYVIRRRLLIELIENCAAEDRYDFVNDILLRYKSVKRIYGYKLNSYWSNISTVESYFKTNMDFLKPSVRDYFFKQYDHSLGFSVFSGFLRKLNYTRKSIGHLYHSKLDVALWHIESCSLFMLLAYYALSLYLFWFYKCCYVQGSVQHKRERSRRVHGKWSEHGIDIVPEILINIFCLFLCQLFML